ncbi:MAG: DDE-type integrase/transposase/recombinase, partial [Oscillospiraceae bacterium]|nr:DDE-type integrase/transposase/recombinase [Oscillospiraceae bacterium]
YLPASGSGLGGDITYIPTGEGWLYLAIVKDLCTRKIVGYAFSELLNRLSEWIDTQLALAALEMAYRRRKPPKGLIFHSDWGVQYASRASIRNGWWPMVSARACPAEVIPTITPLPKTSSAVLSVGGFT